MRKNMGQVKKTLKWARKKGCKISPFSKWAHLQKWVKIESGAKINLGEFKFWVSLNGTGIHLSRFQLYAEGCSKFQVYICPKFMNDIYLVQFYPKEEGSNLWTNQRPCNRIRQVEWS
jgi:hypothetical protein